MACVLELDSSLSNVLTVEALRFPYGMAGIRLAQLCCVCYICSLLLLASTDTSFGNGLILLTVLSAVLMAVILYCSHSSREQQKQEQLASTGGTHRAYSACDDGGGIWSVGDVGGGSADL